MFGKKSAQYNLAVRKFALTVHFHSSRSYRFIRRTFNNHLPHISTLKKWYCKSLANGNPGISEHGLNTLKNISEKMKTTGEKLIVSVAMDEIYIKKHVQWSDSRKKFLGFISHGKHEGNELPVATNVLVFLVSGVNTPFHQPIAHYFITSLKALEKADLITQVVSSISSMGILVAALTFDGLPNNFTACHHLGARFEIENLRARIRNPIDGSNIYMYNTRPMPNV